MRTDETPAHQVHEDESEGVSSKIFELPLLVGYKNYVTWLRHRLDQDTIPMAYGKRANAKRTSEKNSSNKDPTIEMVLSAAKRSDRATSFDIRPTKKRRGASFDFRPTRKLATTSFDIRPTKKRSLKNDRSDCLNLYKDGRLDTKVMDLIDSGKCNNELGPLGYILQHPKTQELRTGQEKPNHDKIRRDVKQNDALEEDKSFNKVTRRGDEVVGPPEKIGLTQFRFRRGDEAVGPPENIDLTQFRF